MKTKKSAEKKTGLFPFHIAVYYPKSGLINEEAISSILQKINFLSVSVQNGILQKTGNNISTFHSFNKLKKSLLSYELDEKILVISADKLDEGFSNIIKKAKEIEGDFSYVDEKSSIILKNFIFQSVDWDNNTDITDSLENYLTKNYSYTKDLIKFNFSNPKSKIQTVSEDLNFSPIKKLQLIFKSFFVKPLKNKNIYLKRNDYIFKENINYRVIFGISLVILFFLLPILSFDAGISGDEDKHVDQAQKVYSYFATHGQDTSYLKSPYGPFYAYNITFDVFLHVLIKKFDIKNIYEFRHIINSLTGFTTILFCGLLVVYIAGWRAGMISLILLFFSPRFLGHSLNNPKDVPFAMSYIFTIYFLIKFINKLPKISIKYATFVALGIGLALNIRIGGLLLIAYLYLFVALKTISDLKFEILNQKNWAYLGKLIGLLILISIVGYTIGFIFWPYGLKAPLKNPFDSLKNMTNFTVSIKQAFEGEFIWSDNVPWYYTIKYVLISSPVIVLTGVLISFISIIALSKKYGWINTVLLFFSFIFPFAYIIHKKSNVYGGWRHMIFPYILMVAIASISINHLFYIFKNKYVKYSIIIVLAVLLIHPVLHTFKNHPNYYVYFNQLVGGVKGAYGNYEMDYYYNSLKQGTDWLKENKFNNDTSSNITIASNHADLVSYYLRYYKKVKVTYVRYYDRGNTDWDYAIIANSYINPLQQKRGFWPPENTIHTIDVDGVPICAILKRNNKLDLEGYQKLKKRDFIGAINDLNKSIELEKTNEAAYMNLATAYMYIMQFDKAKTTIQKLLEVYPKYDKGLNLLGLVYYNQKNYEEAYKIFTSITELNPKFVSAYHNLGLVFLRMNKKNDALKYFQKAIKTNSKYKPPYLAIANILKEAGKEKEAQKYIDAANKLK